MVGATTSDRVFKIKIPRDIAENWWDDNLASLYEYSGRRTGRRANPFLSVPERGGEVALTADELPVLVAQCEDDLRETSDRELCRQYRITATLCRRAIKDLTESSP